MEINDLSINELEKFRQHLISLGCGWTNESSYDDLIQFACQGYQKYSTIYTSLNKDRKYIFDFWEEEIREGGKNE